MKIKSVHATAVEVPVTRVAAYSKRMITHVAVTIVEVETDAGISGLGEVRGTFCARIVNDAVAAGLVGGRELAGPTDDELLHLIGRRAETRGGPVADRIRRRWLPALRTRRLPKRAAELTAADLGDRSLPPWIEAPGAERRRLEDQLAEALSLEPGEVVIDFPYKPAMFQLDLLVRRRSGRAERLGKAGIPGVIDLPRVARELYRTSRVLRVFTFEKRSLAPDEVIGLVTGA